MGKRDPCTSSFTVRGARRWFYTASAARGSGPGSSHRQPEHAQFIPALLQDVLQTYTTLLGRICSTAAAIDGQRQTNSHRTHRHEEEYKEPTTGVDQGRPPESTTVQYTAESHQMQHEPSRASENRAKPHWAMNYSARSCTQRPFSYAQLRHRPLPSVAPPPFAFRLSLLGGWLAAVAVCSPPVNINIHTLERAHRGCARLDRG